MSCKRMLVVVVALGSLGVGCTDDCTETCKGEQKCADAPQALKAANCNDVCRDLEDVGNASGCSKQVDAYTSCDAKLSDKCGDTRCDAEWTAALSCIASYCGDHPTDAKCSAIFAELGRPTDTTP